MLIIKNKVMDKEIKFVEWMLKINNIYYADNEAMSLGIYKISKNEKIQCT